MEGAVDILASVGVTLAGVLVVVLALRDIWHTLFHPAARGSINRLVAHDVWRLGRWLTRGRPDALSLVGPAAFTSVVAVWGLLLVLGWALVYWPHLPGEFLIASGLVTENQDSFLDAIYVSMVTLGTLGYGDIAPRAEWLRLVAPLQGFIGFGFLTVVISWVLSIYPVLSRRRSAAHETWLLHDTVAERNVSIVDLPECAAERLVADFVSRLVAIRGDIEQFPITYYFRDREEREALPCALPTLLGVARSTREHASPAIALQADRLDRSLRDLAGTLAREFPHLGSGNTLARYAEDHRHAIGGANAADGN